jgi:hypothetical protein
MDIIDATMAIAASILIGFLWGWVAATKNDPT